MTLEDFMNKKTIELVWFITPNGMDLIGGGEEGGAFRVEQHMTDNYFSLEAEDISGSLDNIACFAEALKKWCEEMKSEVILKS